MVKVFIDGEAGTTGLRIHERLEKRSDLELIRIEPDLRKDPEARRAALNASDIAFLCLPDAAAIQALELIENPDTCVIDTSCAHRTSCGWTYGFAELAGARSRIARSKRITNPGCHASGFIALVQPLVAAGVVRVDACLSVTSLTGYSGGGKSMIAAYEHDPAPLLAAPRLYGLNQTHKHLPEMVQVCGLAHAPRFLPIVSNYYAGMEVIVALDTSCDLVPGQGVREVREVLREVYSQGLVRYVEGLDEDGFISAGAMCGRDDMQVGVFGQDERILCIARFDNLGKGASGAAIQNMNIVLGVEETCGLVF